MDEFTDTLQALLNTKPPGVSGSKIRKAQELALSNVSSESVLVQRLFTHCKKTPATHKLGVLYVVDAIVRSYQDKARENGETVDENAPEGSYAAGVYQITELIESIMDDAMAQPMSSDIKDKVRKLVDIWERAETFPAATIKSIKSKHFHSSSAATPPGSPPASAVHLFKSAFDSRAPKQEEEAKSKQDQTNSILQALASLTKKAPQTGADNNSQSQPPAAAVTGQPWNLPVPARSSQVEVNNGSQRSRSRSPSQGQRSSSMRDRSPRRQQSQDAASSGDQEYKERNIKYVTDLPAGCVRVSSRTLFIGGIAPYMSEPELEDQLRPFGRVQSMIFHKEKKHAFVKTYTRQEAENVKDKLEELHKGGGTGLRARWGVGFGPRDCCNYQAGVSVIPIDRLTDADKRWIVTADNGGTGGRPLVSGIEVEEPDIEIGAGVSSKAISKRMPTNSARNGPQSSREHGGGGGGGGHRRRNNENVNGWPGAERGRHYSQSQSPPPPPQQQQQPQPQPQQPPQQGQQAGMPQMQFNPMQMMQMFQNGQMPPQFQQMAAFFQQQQQQQNQNQSPQ